MDIQLGNYGVVYFLLFVHFFCLMLCASRFDYPTANLSTSWTISPSDPQYVSFSDGSTVRAILLRGSFGPKFACGFFCNGNCNSYLFAIFIVQTNSASGITLPAIGYPQVVWSANRNNPVRINSALQLTSDGDLILKDADETVVWSTNTGRKSVVGLNLTDLGNLVLFDRNGATIWQSFDHPTDSLVPGQKLIAGKKLVPSVSPTNWTEQKLLSFKVLDDGMVAWVESNPPQKYYTDTSTGRKISAEPSYVTLQNGSFSMFINSADPSAPDRIIRIPLDYSAQYIRFSPDGHLRLYQWTNSWEQVQDLVVVAGGECFYPTVCGSYGICSSGQCSCPTAADGFGTTYFRRINEREPVLGCSETNPLSCEASQFHGFIELRETTYFSRVPDLENVDLESCKEACSKNFSCKAAMFNYVSNSSSGFCYMPNQIFSLINNGRAMDQNSTIYLKVQNVPANSIAPQQKKNNRLAVVLGSIIGSFFGLLILIGILVFLSRKQEDDVEDEEEGYLNQVSGMLARFSYEELKAGTENFSKLLGKGGFGSVFEGTLADGTKVAVKCLNGLAQVKKSFLAEVESIGSIHHVNLVRLLGFCADKSHRILVYEFMPNGSLDKWIFHQSNESLLDWKQKKNIILDIAKGLTYLHEDCRRKIIHLDIKPQNILLDHNYNAKICDFGLSKLIDRDQSKVVTKWRGTPGYMAPEWLTSVITEKVDVYSFGVVLLEMLCGRKNYDSSQPEELMHLLKVVESKQAEELLDLVEHSGKDTEYYDQEIMNMMKIATWCLQKDDAARPSMSMVIKGLEGLCEVDCNLDHNSSNLPLTRPSSDATPIVPWVLSGPR